MSSVLAHANPERPNHDHLATARGNTTYRRWPVKRGTRRRARHFGSYRQGSLRCPATETGRTSSPTKFRWPTAGLLETTRLLKGFKSCRRVEFRPIRARASSWRASADPSRPLVPDFRRVLSDRCTFGVLLEA